jgi:hypothetical protein
VQRLPLTDGGDLVVAAAALVVALYGLQPVGLADDWAWLTTGPG